MNQETPAQQNLNKTLIGRWDIILVLVLLVIGAAFYLLIINSSADAEALVTVSVSGKQTEAIPLDTDGEYYFADMPYPFTLEIKNGQARLLDASCPDKYCQHTGWIRLTRQAIVCMPNQVSITIENPREENPVDSITF